MKKIIKKHFEKHNKKCQLYCCEFQIQVAKERLNLLDSNDGTHDSNDKYMKNIKEKGNQIAAKIDTYMMQCYVDTKQEIIKNLKNKYDNDTFARCCKIVLDFAKSTN